MSKIKDFFNKIRHEYYTIARILAFAAAIVLVFWQMPRSEKFKYEFEKNKPWQHETLYAPFDFPIYKDAETLAKENLEALNSVDPVFRFNSESYLLAQKNLSEKFEAQWKDNKGDHDLNWRFVRHVFDSIEQSGIVTYSKEIDGLSPGSAVNIVRNQVVQTIPFESLLSTKAAAEKVKQLVAKAPYGINRDFAEKILLECLKQNVSYDTDLTQREVNRALQSVSLTNGVVQKDELVIAEGEIINDRHFAVLSSLQREYVGHELSSNESKLILLGQFILVTMLFVLFAFYLKRLWNKEVYSELKKINMILLLMLLMIIPSFWIMRLHPSYILLMPVSILAIMMATFFDARLSFVTLVFAVLTISLAVTNPFQYIFMQLVVGLTVIFTLRNQRHSRISYFMASLFIFLMYVLVYVAFCLISGSKIELPTIGLLALNALFTLLSLPLISVFEKVFGMTTPLTLLEYSNTNSPLLRQLATDAPGTFQHSFQVANLCEEVLYEIGGNALLARTGALYHDVGKMRNPIYFTENQHGGYNSHNDISNVESAQIIISHVMDGIDLAHKAHLPEEIVDFIRTHHGTRQTEYFYVKEKQEHPDEEIDVANFTYHGPIPFSRETAVLMICDTVEAASRSLKDPDSISISKLVDGLVDKLIAANQFRNTDLTLRDFETIRKVLKKKLMSIYHVRIAYPE